MKDNAELAKTLGRVFKNSRFIHEAILDENGNFVGRDNYYDILNSALQYYILTRDTKLLSPSDIREKMAAPYEMPIFADKTQKLADDLIKDNLIDNGVMTVSFNGYKKDRISALGFDPPRTMEEKQKYPNGRELISQLEDLIGKSNYTISEEIAENQSKTGDMVYFTSPGAKTIGYALGFSPERLFEGPLRQDGPRMPMIVGETKAQYYYRVAEAKLKNKYIDTTSADYQVGLEIAKKTVDFFCSKRPAVALVDVKDIRYKEVWNGVVTEKGGTPLQVRIEDAISMGLLNFFTQDFANGVEGNNIENLAIRQSDIPREAVHVFDMPDMFEIYQLAAKEKGLQFGDLINEDLEVVGKAPDYLVARTLEGTTLYDLASTAKPSGKDKTDHKPAIRAAVELAAANGTLEMDIDEFDLDSVESLRAIREGLAKTELDVLKSDYVHKDNTSGKIGLADTLIMLKQRGLFEQILADDTEILQDDLQYQSDLHGVPHTRRVAFFSNLISKSDRENKRLMYVISKGHDIGRINDYEDSEHGKYSVNKIKGVEDERLAELSDEEKLIYKFVVIQHSLPTKQSKMVLDDIAAKQRRRSHLQTFASRLGRTGLSRDIHRDGLQKMANEFMGTLDRTEPYSDEEFEAVKEKMEAEVEKLSQEEFINLNVNRAGRVLETFKDADKLDRVRLDPRGMMPTEGLDVSRLSSNESKQYETLAYESLHKLLPVLDIEKVIASIDRQIEALESERAQSVIPGLVEGKMQERSAKIDSMLGRISEKSKPRFNIPNLRETVQGLINRIKSKGKEVGEEVK